MKSYFFALLSLIVASAYATRYSHSSTFYGCPTECHTEKEPKCESGLPSDRHFVALHERYFKSGKKYCNNYWVGMILDDKANGDYKMLRGKVVDQCGTCAETQVDLSSDMFGKIAKHSTGVVQMMYVLINKDTNEIMDGPVYSSDTLNQFAKRHGISKDAVVESFKEGAKHLNKHSLSGMHDFPWRSGAFNGSQKKTTEKTTVRKTTTVAHHTHVHKTTEKVTTIEKTTTIHKVTKKIDLPVTKKVPNVPVVTQKPVDVPVIPKVETTVEVPANKTEEAPVVQKPVVQKPIAQKPVDKKPVEKPIPEAEGGSSPVAAGVIGFGVVGAAGVGLLMLKRQSPQKYDDLKQKFPEAFGNLKRSVSRGASTIKRGVSRSVSRRGNTQVNTPPLPASYSFTLSNEDGLPRVALYDDPYPTKTHGAQHW